MIDFVSLHNHTQASLLHSLITVKDLFGKAKELGQSSIAIADYGTCAAMWDGLKISRDTGVKFIAGCECYFVDDVENKNEKLRYVVLLAKNAVGYSNILKLNRAGFDHSSMFLKKIFPVIDWKLLEKHSDGVICLTGCGNGIFGQLLNDKKFEQAEDTLKRLYNIFGDNLGVEVQSHNMSRAATAYLGATNQFFTNAQAIRIAKKHGLRIVPTTNAHYLKKEDSEVHDVMLAIASMQPVYSNNRIKYNVPDLYMKTGDEVMTFFARNNSEEFAKEICANTLYFADKCEKPDWIEPKVLCGGSLFPVFDVKSESDYDNFINWKNKQNDNVKKLDEDSAYLRFKCELKLVEKKLNNKIYIERLDEELEVLDYQKFSSYLLIVADYIEWARRNGGSVGCGRGSVGGSLAAYLLDIHKADPIKYGLIFARFQNRERKSYPDIDVDFSGSCREKVIDYIKQKYGHDNVASISNLNHITPKVYARDIARSCDLAGNRAESVALANNIADAIPSELKDARHFTDLSQAPLFAEYCKRYPKIAKNSIILGMTRNYSSHAAAIIISKKPITGSIPLRKDKDGAVVVEYEKNTSEDNGLLKMDILGLSTLDLIDQTVELIKRSGKELDQNYINYEYYDKPTYDLITSGKTYGVFQFGVSGGTIDLCKKIKPKSIDDLAIVTCLARPALSNIRKEFIAVRAGKKNYKLLHPSLKGAFDGTFGFGVYDESILKLAQDVAGWSLHSADRLRKMVKEKGKNPERDEKLRIEFIDGAVDKGIERKMAIRIWDEEIGKFNLYSFCRAHSVLYSFISYTTAFLKAHYPTEFLLANLMAEIKSNAPNAKENVDKIKQELKHFGIKVFPPNINTSPFSYQIQNDNSLLTGLDALKFVGDEAIQDIIAKRPFTNFDDFMTRVDSKKVRATTIQALAASGALDCFGLSRKIMFLYCQDYRKKLQVWQKKHKDEPFAYPYPVEKEWTKSELYALEKNYLSESFTYTKDEGFCGYFGNNAFKFVSINDLQNKERVSPVKAEIKNIFIFKVKKEGSKYLGKDMAKVLLEDKYGDQLTMTIFPDKWQIVQDRAKYIGKGKIKFDSGAAISFMGTVNEYDNEKNLILDEFLDITAAPALPKDLKAKKLSLKRKKSKDELVLIENKIDNGSQEAIAEELEDDLFFEGFIELDGEDSEDD